MKLIFSLLTFVILSCSVVFAQDSSLIAEIEERISASMGVGAREKVKIVTPDGKLKNGFIMIGKNYVSLVGETETLAIVTFVIDPRTTSEIKKVVTKNGQTITTSYTVSNKLVSGIFRQTLQFVSHSKGGLTGMSIGSSLNGETKSELFKTYFVRQF